VRVRELRLARGWSQAQLAELSGLSVRTIQRIENGTHPGLESLNVLARVFEVEIAELHADLGGPGRPMSFFEAIRYCLTNYAEFTGRGSRAEFWWFTLAIALVATVAAAISPLASTIVATATVVPWLAAGARRLRDAGQSPWWLFIVLAPIGGLVVVAFLCAMPSADARARTQVAGQASVD
jgi:transcriptional regulator with XRE-family HTH domain